MSIRADARKNYDLLVEVARDVFVKQSVEASLHDIARRADVGMGTLCRHLPSHDSLLETLLRSRFVTLAARAESLLLVADPAAVLLEQPTGSVAFIHRHHEIIAPLINTIDSLESILYNACVALRTAGTSLLTRAQRAEQARSDSSGDELFDLVAALAWLREQPSHVPRAERIPAVLIDAILIIGQRRLITDEAARLTGDRNASLQRLSAQRVPLVSTRLEVERPRPGSQPTKAYSCGYGWRRALRSAYLASRPSSTSPVSLYRRELAVSTSSEDHGQGIGRPAAVENSVSS